MLATITLATIDYASDYSDYAPVATIPAAGVTFRPFSTKVLQNSYKSVIIWNYSHNVI